MSNGHTDRPRYSSNKRPHINTVLSDAEGDMKVISEI